MKKIKIFIISFFVFFYSCKDNKSVIEDSNEIVQEKFSSISKPTNVYTAGKVNDLSIGCGYNYNLNTNELAIYYPQERELKIIENIIKYSGLPLNFEIFSGDIDNAVATVIDNKRYIIYDSNMLKNIDEHSSSYWSSVSILAHEIGHHLSGHTLSHDINRHDSELQADKFSGFVLYKMGANEQQAINAMTLLGSETDSESHPNKRKRIEAILEGWNEASKQRYQGAIPPPPNDSASDYTIYDAKSLISNEYRTAENSDYFYSKYNFLYGIITDVSKDLSEIKVHIVKSSPSFAKDFRDIKNEDWTVYLDQTSWGGDNEMSHSASMNLPFLMVPGRRLKFAMVEGCPGCGTSANGMWSFIYLEGLNGDAF